MPRKEFDSSHFDDAFFLSVDFSNWKEAVSLSFHCPQAKGVKNEKRYFRITFKRVLFFGFEAAALGEFGTKPMFVNGVYQLPKSEELKIWRDRIKALAKPEPGYSKGMRSRKYTDLHHFVVDSIEFQPLAFFSGSRGFQIICRDFEVERIPNPGLPAKADLDPKRIPAGK